MLSKACHRVSLVSSTFSSTCSSTGPCTCMYVGVKSEALHCASEVRRGQAGRLRGRRLMGRRLVFEECVRAGGCPPLVMRYRCGGALLPLFCRLGSKTSL